jgi:hypothetical protein
MTTLRSTLTTDTTPSAWPAPTTELDRVRVEKLGTPVAIVRHAWGTPPRAVSSLGDLAPGNGGEDLETPASEATDKALNRGAEDDGAEERFRFFFDFRQRTRPAGRPSLGPSPVVPCGAAEGGLGGP